MFRVRMTQKVIAVILRNLRDIFLCEDKDIYRLLDLH